MANLAVKSEALNSVNVKVSATGDAYSASANVNIQGSSITSFENGVIKDLQGVTLANFSNFGNLTLNFLSSLTTEEQLNILTFLNLFFDSVKATSVSDLTNVTTTTTA